MYRLIHVYNVAGVTWFELLTRSNVAIGKLLIYSHHFQGRRDDTCKIYVGLFNGAGELADESPGFRKNI